MKPIKTLDDVARGLSALKVLDPRLIPVIKSADPVPLRLREPTLGSLMKIVVSQQVSVQSAAAIWGRFEAVFDPASPAQIAKASDEDMQAVGLSRPKIKTLRAIAIEALDNNLDCPSLMGKQLNMVNDRLTSIHGVGPWTAEVFALFCLGHPDIFPVGDVALQHGVQQAFKLDERPKGDVLTSIAEQWSPWRGVAARLFWAYYATYKKRDALPV
ncbi:MAG: DNA-3-methyladenine glycosylase 2 family protein [Hyphomicrobiales bacterium]